MPRRNMNTKPKKAKNFTGSLKRLFSELGTFRLFILLSIVLAILSSILTIATPSILKDLTNEITEGIKVNEEGINKLSEILSSDLSEDNIQKHLKSILRVELNSTTIQSINNSTTISNEDKNTFNELLTKISKTTDESKVYSYLSRMPSSVLKVLLPSSTYNNIKISSTEKIDLLNSLTNLSKEQISINDLKLSNQIILSMLTDSKIEDTTITKAEKLSIISALQGNNDPQTIYSELDKLPDNIKSYLEPSMNMDRIITLSLILLLLYILSTLLSYITSLIMSTVTSKFANKLRKNISKKINRLSLSYFDTHTIGDVLSRITNDVDTVAQNLNQSLTTLVTGITLLLGTVIMMFITNTYMALTAITSSLIGFIFMGIILGRSQKYFTRRQVELGNLDGHIEEVYAGLNVLKAYNGEEDANKKFDFYNKRVYEANKKSLFLSGLMQPMMGFIGNFGYVAVCIVGAILTLNGSISFGVIVAFMTYVRLFTNPLTQIAQAMSTMQQTAASSERVFEFMDEEEMPVEHPKTKLLKEEVKGNIEFNNVKFTYKGNDKPTIKNFTASASKGDKIAIVGKTGAGKTTLVNLLMRFYEIDEGRITIDGTDIKDISRDNLHELFTMVLQDTWIFNGTVKENIKYNTNATDEEITSVCKKIGLDHFIGSLPKGYDTVLGDNDSVSLGERQLLTIARGMLENSPLIILDEATSNVDTRTEELVQKAMDKLAKGKTSFIIAHRLSTIKNANLILVMDEGNIVEVGTHEELIKKNGVYASLYNSQFEL